MRTPWARAGTAGPCGNLVAQAAHAAEIMLLAMKSLSSNADARTYGSGGSSSARGPQLLDPRHDDAKHGYLKQAGVPGAGPDETTKPTIGDLTQSEDRAQTRHLRGRGGLRARRGTQTSNDEVAGPTKTGSSGAD